MITLQRYYKCETDLSIDDCYLAGCLVKHMVPPVIGKLITNVVSNLHPQYTQTSNTKRHVVFAAINLSTPQRSPQLDKCVACKPLRGEVTALQREKTAVCEIAVECDG